jgi:hypothetical protein
MFPPSNGHRHSRSPTDCGLDVFKHPFRCRYKQPREQFDRSEPPQSVFEYEAGGSDCPGWYVRFAGAVSSNRMAIMGRLPTPHRSAPTPLPPATSDGSHSHYCEPRLSVAARASKHPTVVWVQTPRRRHSTFGECARQRLSRGDALLAQPVHLQKQPKRCPLRGGPAALAWIRVLPSRGVGIPLQIWYPGVVVCRHPRRPWFVNVQF